MDNKPENPRAFATDRNYQKGMTLRDYFANSAIKGILSAQSALRAHGRGNDTKIIKTLVTEAFLIADEMLKQR